MPEFKIAESHAEIAAATIEGYRRAEFIDRVLAAMGRAGFERVRLYEVTEDVAADDKVAVLVREDADEGHEGFDVPLDEASLMVDGTLSADPVVAHARRDGSDPDWVETLGLTDRRWVEIPVTAGTEMVGLLACDWLRTSPKRIDEADKQQLRAIGALVGSLLGLKPIVVLDSYRRARRKWSHDDPRQLVCAALPHLAEVLDAAIASVFAFSWTDQSLTKIHQHVTPRLSRRAEALGELPERYPVGEYLTGEAWAEREHGGMRHVVSFESLRTHRHTRVERRSDDWHTALLGEVRSVIYGVVGTVDRRYLLRFINRASRPRVPFVYEMVALETILGDLRGDVDAALGAQRLGTLRSMARVTSKSAEPAELLTQVAEQLTAESIGDFAVACHSDRSVQFGFAAFRGRRLARTHFDLQADRAGDRLYSQAREGDTGVHAIGENSSRRSLAGVLHAKGFRAVLTVPLESGLTKGAVLVPLDSIVRDQKRHSGSRLPPDCGYGTVSMLLAYARLIGNAIETRQSRAKVDGARRALGLMGHELRTPINEIGSVAERAIELAAAVADDLIPIDPERAAKLTEQLDEHMSEVEEALRAVDVPLQFAPIVAKESERLELLFREVDLHELLRQAVSDVESELRFERDGRSYEFELKQSARGLHREHMIADREHLRHAFKNVVRNAAKYSLPPGDGSPMPIEVFGEPQTGFVAVKVRNWGHGIPPERRDLIFEAWVRGDVNDRLKKIGGMGLGLYLTRQIVMAHRGEVRFWSKFVLNDPAKRRLNEGFQTEFELRIPRRLKAGKYIYHLDGRLEGPTHEHHDT